MRASCELTKDAGWDEDSTPTCAIITECLQLSSPMREGIRFQGDGRASRAVRGEGGASRSRPELRGRTGGVLIGNPRSPCIWPKDYSLLLLFFFCLFAISRAAPGAYGGSQARGPIGAVAAGLRQSHSHAGSEPRLRPTPQLTATPDP